MTPGQTGKRATDRAQRAATIECIEAEAWAQLHSSLPEDYRRRMGIAVHRFGPATALVTSRSDTLAVNRVIGLGFDEPLSARRLDEIIEVYRAADAERFLVQWSPEACPSEARQWLAERGFRIIPPTVKFVREPDAEWSPSVPPSDLQIIEIGPDQGDLFERTVAEPLGVRPELSAGIRSTIGQPGWRFYLALDGERAVAGGAMYSESDCAWCGLTATIATDRARGAQSALLARRIADASTNGCWCITADTIPDLPDRRNPSYHNMRRAGFEVLYDRANYLRELRPPAPRTI